VAGPLEALLGRKRTVRIGGLHGASTGYVLAAVARRDGGLLAITADARAMDGLRLDLDAFLPGPALPFPAWPRDIGGGTPDADVLGARVRVLEALGMHEGAKARAPLVVVAPLAALTQEVPSPAVLDAASLVLRTGDEHALHAFLEHLALSGYARVGAVEAQGEFAARGGVLDLWSWGASTPFRLDFFGDEIESIRRLDAATQRSGDAVRALRLLALPAERFLDPGPGEGVLLPASFPAALRVARVETEALAEAATRSPSFGATDPEHLRRLDALLAERPALETSALPLGASGDLDVEVGGVDVLRGVALRTLEVPGEHPAEPVERTERIAAAFADLAARVERLVLHCRAPGEEERLRELFEEHDPGRPVAFRRGALSRSFRFGPTRTAHVAYDDLADLPLRERRLGGAGPRGRPIQDFLELQVGGPVVHLHHGIGLFRGLVTLEGRDGLGEFLKVEFAEGTIVYVPVARIDLVQRYVGTGRPPRLSRLGGTEWANKKRRVSAAVEELAEDLLETQAARQRNLRRPLPPAGEWQREFEDSFPFADTPDQAAASRAVTDDLGSDRPMDRLLCGDVGYGKTEVALRAVFRVVTSGRQAAVLVPTKVLAEQHVRVFTQRLAPYPIRVRALSSLHGTRENKITLEGLADGTVDVVVGTHRLLSKDVSFRDLGLVVVDEEQRFGVKQKERLKALRHQVDILTLSATPIPRTLHMALLGIRDISNLTTPPVGRHPVETRVSRESDDLVAEAVRRELDRGGQVFIVSSRIRELPLVARRLQERVPEARLVAIHGQMQKELIEDRMLRFVRGEADVMLATTIIESGLDIPNANTIVIRDADRYGLAELHQLRGRVGRERRHAHALILLPPDRTVRPEAAERLRAIEEYSELGAGFRIAMRDLEIRGAGNLLGPQQSGHIAAVGYDLYCRLLADAVDRVRGRKDRPTEPAYLAVDLPGDIPPAYVADEREKFRLFRRISAAREVEELEDLAAELADRFGPMPGGVARLLLAQRVRIRAGSLGFHRVDPAERPGVILRAPDDPAAVARLRAAGATISTLGPSAAFLPAYEAESAEASLRHADAVLARARGGPSTS
jgi:transcription-repair coupling factor (superfamily II helicase)